eukprot:4487702-Pleurochrysis_carterae.AAC.3
MRSKTGHQGRFGTWWRGSAPRRRAAARRRRIPFGARAATCEIEKIAVMCRGARSLITTFNASTHTLALGRALDIAKSADAYFAKLIQGAAATFCVHSLLYTTKLILLVVLACPGTSLWQMW